MPQSYDVPSGADAVSAVTDNTTVTTVTPPQRANGMLLSAVTTSVYLCFGQGTPSATLGHVLPKDQVPWFVPFAKPFKWLPTANAASRLNITYLYS